MFKITIEGETMSALAASVLAMAAQFQTTAVMGEVGNAKPAKPAKAATVKEIEPGKSTTAATETTPVEPVAQTTSDPVVASDDTGPVDPAELKGRLGKLIDKAGPDVVKQIFAEFGAAKFPEVPAEQHRALSVRVDELLAA